MMSPMRRDIPYHPGNYPSDIKDPTEWDSFWTDVLDLARTTATGNSALLVWRKGPISPPFRAECHRRMAQLRQAGMRRVLFPGNGLRVLPEFIRDFGLDVTALDFSKVAVDYAAAHPATPDERDSFYTASRRVFEVDNSLGFEDVLDADATQERVRALTEPGGTLTYNVGDLRDVPGDGEYDAAFVLNLILLYSQGDRLLLLRQLHSLLCPRGVLLIQDVCFLNQDEGGEEAFSTHLQEAGFIIEFADVEQWEHTLPAQAMKRLQPAKYKREREERRHDSEMRAWLRRKEGHPLAVFLPT